MKHGLVMTLTSIMERHGTSKLDTQTISRRAVCQLHTDFGFWYEMLTKRIPILFFD